MPAIFASRRHRSGVPKLQAARKFRRAAQRPPQYAGRSYLPPPATSGISSPVATAEWRDNDLHSLPRVVVAVIL